MEAVLLRLALLNLAAAGVGLLLMGSFAADALAAPQVGDTAYVLGTGGTGVRVRSGPGSSYDIRGIVPEGATVTVQDGPQIDGDQTWYQIRGTDGSGERIRGWVAGQYLVSTTSVSASSVATAGTTTAGSATGATSSGDVAVGTRKFEAKVTGYSSGTGGVGYYTSTGTRVHWGTCSVDPRYIPLGSLLTIDGLDGMFTAEDTGSAVVGAMVDVWFPDLESARRWNTKYKSVTVLREGPN